MPGEPKFVDLWFTPSPTNQTTIDVGLLNRIATTPCLLEPFRNAPTCPEVRSCLLRLLWLQEAHRRQAKREKESQTETSLPRLWILAVTTSQPGVREFGGVLQPDWGGGIYHLAPALKVTIVVIDQLPATPDTIWLRLLGRDQTQQRTISELLALPQDDLRRSRVLQLLTNWRLLYYRG